MQLELRRLGWLSLGSALLVAASVAASDARGDARPGPVRIRSLPFAIEECGHYVLARCLEGVAGRHGITVAHSLRDVTIDLNGFAIRGVPGSLDGIHAPAGLNFVVRNGTVSEWGGHGVYLGGLITRVSDVQARDNGGSGIVVNDEAVVDRCLARNNGGEGICAERCAVVTDCVSASNGGDGIVIGIVPNIVSGSVVRSSTSCFNAGVGIRVAPASLVADCSVAQNSGGAIDGLSCLIRGNSVSGTVSAPFSTLVENHSF